MSQSACVLVIHGGVADLPGDDLEVARTRPGTTRKRWRVSRDHGLRREQHQLTRVSTVPVQVEGLRFALRLRSARF